MSTVNFITILLLSRYMMGVPLRGSILLLSAVAVLFVFTSLSLGLLISVVASTQKTALLLSGMGLMMPTVLLSGIIFPCENMPAVLQWLSHLIPAKWFIIMVKKIMIQGAGFPYIIGIPLYNKGVLHIGRDDRISADGGCQKVQNQAVDGRPDMPVMIGLP